MTRERKLRHKLILQNHCGHSHDKNFCYAKIVAALFSLRTNLLRCFELAHRMLKSRGGIFQR
jgi:hypothetical protein